MTGPRQIALRPARSAQKHRNLRRLLHAPPRLPRADGAGQATVAEIHSFELSGGAMAETTQTSPQSNLKTTATTTPNRATSASGLKFARKFSKPGVSPYD